MPSSRSIPKRRNAEDLLAVTILLFCALAASCSKAPPANQANSSRSPVTAQGEPWFEEVAAQANVDFKHSSGAFGRFWIPEMETGGVGLLDYDGDGNLDIFCVNGGSLNPAATHRPGHKLYRNLGQWKFEDVTDRAGVAGHGAYGMGCACADYDGDGDIDIYVTGLGRNILYRNNGDGTFTDVTREAGVAVESWSTSAAFFDYDGDGHLDLVVANYIKWSPEQELECYSQGGRRDYCSPMNYKAAAMDALFHNRGDGAFENVTRSAGLDQAYGNGLGVACADFNGDGRLDIFVANDAMPNQLWINQGNGTFVDEAMIRGCAVNAYGVARAGMGVAAADIDQDGWLDLYVTHLVSEGNGVFMNRKGYFTDTQHPKGPAAVSVPDTGFGVGFADFDHDGHLDVYIANGRVKYGQRQFDPNDPYAEPNTLLRGVGNGQFEEVVPQGGVAQPLVATSRGAAFGDLDNDGDLDIVVVNRDGPVHLLRNIAPKKGTWILLRVLKRNGTHALNSVVRVEAGGRTYWRHVQPNQSYCSSHDPRIHVGLGAAQQVDRVVVRWPSGVEEAFGPFEAARQIELREGSGRKP